MFEEMEQLIAGLGSGDGHVGLEELRGRRARFLRHLELIGRWMPLVTFICINAWVVLASGGFGGQQVGMCSPIASH